MDKDEFWAELEALGEEAVRQKDEEGLYAGKNKRWVDGWLKMKARQKPNKTPWHRTLSGMIVIGIIIAFCAGLGVAYSAYHFGWL